MRFPCLFLILSLGAIAVLPVMARAQPGASPKVDPTCQIRYGKADSCAPLVACVGTSGIYFAGRALGWNTGTFAGRTNAGFNCSGQWKHRNAIGLGQAVFECDNGLTGIGYFTSLDGPTGTAIGRGMLSDGRPFRMWSGHQIRQFLINESGDVNARLMCADVPVPIS